MRPEHFIFNRDWYEKLGGKTEFEAYQSEWKRLTPDNKVELIEKLSGFRPSQYHKAKFRSPRLRSILQYYSPLTHDELAVLWNKRRDHPSLYDDVSADIPADERVEDAGLEEAA